METIFGDGSRQQKSGFMGALMGAGKRLLIAAHGNSLRALIKHLDGVSDADIVGLNVPTGVPLVYELDANLRPLKHYYLGDPAEVDNRMPALAAKGKAKT